VIRCVIVGEIMECKKCNGTIASGTYCMRCGTTNDEKPVHMDVATINDVVSNKAEPEDKEKRANDFAVLIKAKEENAALASTGTLTMLVAIISVFCFIVALMIGGQTMLMSAMTGSFGLLSQGDFIFRMVLILLPIAGLIAVQTKRHIESVYAECGNEATDSVIRQLFYTSLKVWGYLFLLIYLLPLLLTILRVREVPLELIGEMFKSMWSFIQTTWSYILLYFGFIGATIFLINLCKTKCTAIKGITALGFFLLLIIYTFM
jgi:hypothetical protein